MSLCIHSTRLKTKPIQHKISGSSKSLGGSPITNSFTSHYLRQALPTTVNVHSTMSAVLQLDQGTEKSMEHAQKFWSRVGEMVHQSS